MTTDTANPATTPAEPDLIASTEDEAALVVWLRDRDVDCPLCHYNLRGLTVPRCPECGHGLGLAVSIIDPDMKAWITLAVAVCGSAGMGFLLLCLVLRTGMPHEGLVDWAIVLYMLTIPGPLVLLRTRRSFRLLPRVKQWTITSVAVCVALAALAILCLGVR
jgi:hypothetical protein